MILIDATVPDLPVALSTSPVCVVDRLHVAHPTDVHADSSAVVHGSLIRDPSTMGVSDDDVSSEVHQRRTCSVYSAAADLMGVGDLADADVGHVVYPLYAAFFDSVLLLGSRPLHTVQRRSHVSDVAVHPILMIAAAIYDSVRSDLLDLIQALVDLVHLPVEVGLTSRGLRMLTYGVAISEVTDDNNVLRLRCLCSL